MDEKSDAEVVDTFVRTITDADSGLLPRERLQFIGAKFGSLAVPMFTELAVSGLRNPTPGANRIDLRDATVAGELSFRESTIRHGCTLAGAEIGGDLTLAGTTIEGDVELLDVECGGEWALGGVTANSVLAIGAIIDGQVSLSGASLTGNVLMQDCRVSTGEGATTGLNASNCDVARRTKLVRTDVHGDCSFAGAAFAHELNIVEGTIDGSLSLVDARVEHGLSLTDGELGEELRANGLTVDDMLLIGGYRFGDRVQFTGATIASVVADPLLLHPGISVVEFTNSELGRFTLTGVDSADLVYEFGGTRISEIEFDCDTPASPLRHLRFLGTAFTGYDFESLKPALVEHRWDLLAYVDEQASAVIQRDAYLSATQGASAVVSALSIHRPTAVSIAAGELTPETFTDLAHALATSAFDADVATLICDPARSTADALLSDGDVSIDIEQRSDVLAVSSLAGYDDRHGFVDVPAVRDELAALASAVAEDVGVRDAERDLAAAIMAALADDVDVDPITVEATFRTAKMAAENEGAQEVAAKFFERELRARRTRHAERYRGATAVRERVSSATDWGSNWLLDVTTGYGERPGRVVALAVFVVALFTGLYALLLPTDPPYGSSLGYAVLSLESFITLVLGSTETIDDPLIRFIAEVEGFLGAFSVALFVFTLTRSIHR